MLSFVFVSECYVFLHNIMHVRTYNIIFVIHHTKKIRKKQKNSKMRIYFCQTPLKIESFRTFITIYAVINKGR